MGRATRSDAELIAACRGDDREAFGEIVERYQRAVGAVSYSGTGDRVLAEDVTQDTFVTAWRQLHTLREVDRLPAWLCGIARNLARTARLKRGRETALDDHDVAGGVSPFEQLRDREDEHAVATSLAQVPETYREALVLFYCEQQSVRAVAQALGISENATHQRLARGRQHLADGVGLVGRTLERRRLQAGLAAAVVAAITAIGSSQVEAATPNRTQGSTMFKFGIAAVLFTAIAGTGYVVARSNTEPSAPATAVAPTTSATTRAANTAPIARPRAAIGTGTSPEAAPDATTSAVGDDPLSCPSVARHLAMMMAQTQPDLVEAIEHGADEVVDRTMKPIADNYLEDCTQLSWSLAIRTCIANADDVIALQSKCEPPPTLPPDRRAAKASGEIQIIDDEPRPAYTGSDESCASVGLHMVSLQRPTDAVLARVPADRRDGIREAMERMLSTVPETVESNCETTPWSLSVRRCMLAATKHKQALACAPR